MSYRDTLAYLYGLQRFGIKLGLHNIARLLEALDNPHRALTVLHIGGTNGKGSTAAMAGAILRAAGLHVGLYTSPHLTAFTERIQVDHRPIPEAQAVALADAVRAAAEREEALRPTFFEFTTAMALVHFARERVDVAVLEVGLGGRLDATNVVRPAAAIITNVGLDHLQYLGKTVEEIAREKAGIIKPGVPVLTGARPHQGLEVIEETCAERGAPLSVLGDAIAAEPAGSGRFHYRSRSWTLRDLELNLRGRHQVWNAALAVAGVECLAQEGLPVSDAAVRQGLREVIWPGRLEVLRQRPTVLLDGAHNPDGAEALRCSLREEFRYHRLLLVIGILEDKDIPGILGVLAPLSDELWLCRARAARAADLELLREHAAPLARRLTCCPTVPDALRQALARAGPADLICVTGSLYVVGEARAWLLGETSAEPAAGVR
ncbi:MAG: bifunctional folylpolyglutamate synthase/dihydrofolate synthase [Deltaproteobacteria bacterium]|nr:bifunctional folylpolyglutamate synthase/dihydrofolate synthase [Deltaproteobacteria bacterium]